MKRKSIYLIALLFAFVATSCTTISQSMREPNTRLELHKDDFVISKQVTAEATTTRVLGIDWSRLFEKSFGFRNHDGETAVSLPIIGNIINEPTYNYALYELMSGNSGYDVVFYPQYYANNFSFLGLYQKVNVKVIARLGKLSATKKAESRSSDSNK